MFGLAGTDSCGFGLCEIFFALALVHVVGDEERLGEMVVADYHEGLDFTHKVEHEVHFHLHKVVFYIAVHFLNCGYNSPDLVNHFTVKLRNLDSVFEFPQKF